MNFSLAKSLNKPDARAKSYFAITILNQNSRLNRFINFMPPTNFQKGINMKIEEIMVKNVITLQRDLSALDAVKIMNKNRIGCLIVVDNGQIAGILTERDMLERVLEECKDPKETRVSEIMTEDVMVGKPDMELVEATRLLFEKKVKKLPIVEGNRLVGLVTLTDIARAASHDRETMDLIEVRTQVLEAFMKDYLKEIRTLGVRA
jgi:CBS domain-containing protein